MSGLVFPKALKELRIHFSQNAGGDAVRAFLTKNYAALKKANPSTPILVREALGIKPMAYARFDYGREEKASLDGNVDAAIKELVGKHDG